MGNTTGGQSVRQQARKAALAAQARRRARQAERDKRLDAAALRLVVALTSCRTGADAGSSTSSGRQTATSRTPASHPSWSVCSDGRPRTARCTASTDSRTRWVAGQQPSR